MKSYLVLKGKKPKIKDGNLLLDKLAGARIKWNAAEQYRNKDQIMADLAKKLEKTEGAKPYVIPGGASYDIGTWGYISAT